MSREAGCTTGLISHRRTAGVVWILLPALAFEPLQAAESEVGKDEHSWLDRSNRLMDLTRAPMTMMESNSPFFQKRELYFFGRLEVEGAHFSSGILSDDGGFKARRFRAGLVGHIPRSEHVSYKVEFDLMDSESRVADAYINWTPANWGTIRVGNQKIAQTLSGSTSTLSTPFMERPLPVLAFTLSRRLGVGYELHREQWGVQGTIFSHDINEQYGSEGYAARAYYVLGTQDAWRWHLGASAVSLDTDDKARFRARPESHGTNTRLVDTGEFSDVDDAVSYGVELAAIKGPFAVQAELYRAVWERADRSNPEFDGWYVESAWLLGGQQQRYHHGKFFRPEIEGRRGAWELAARYSTIDLNSGIIRGGVEDNWSAGVNWYSPLHWRIMVNLIKVDADGPQGKEDPWITQMRVQYYF